MSSPPPSEKRSFYQPELDLLRAGAFFAVFLSHWIPQSLTYYTEHGVPLLLARAVVTFSWAGGTGVMLFFCLSSYLITQLLIREIEARGRIDVRAFYVRRVLRIWPLYFSFTLLAGLMPLFDPMQHFGPKPIAMFLLFCGNWIWSLKIPVETIAAPLWSISVEEQFYLCWPWIVRRATRRGLRNTALVLFAVAAINRVLVTFGVLHTDLWHNTFTQLDSIGLGALLASGPSERMEKLRQGGRARLIVPALLVIYLATLVPHTEGTLFGLFYYPVVACCCATVLFATVGVSLDRSSPAVRALLYLGKISFGLYAFHLLCLYLVEKLIVLLPAKPYFAVAFVARGAGAMFLTIVLASLSYRFLEQPFLRLKARFGEPAPAGA